MDIVYFRFEEDFVEDGIRCIPMVVRQKLDAAGIKLKLGQWVHFNEGERELLALMPVNTPQKIDQYRKYLTGLIKKVTGEEASHLQIEENPAWKELNKVPEVLSEQAKKYDLHISTRQWQQLKPLQRFALIKLCRPGHENRNFPIAMEEFGLSKLIPH